MAGYWQMNDKENFAFFAEGLLPLGINLAVIDYTLAPAARLDRIVTEVRSAVQKPGASQRRSVQRVEIFRKT